MVATLGNRLSYISLSEKNVKLSNLIETYKVKDVSNCTFTKASCIIGTGDCLPDGKSAGAKVKNEELYLHSPYSYTTS
jgi:hypothetical protein